MIRVLFFSPLLLMYLVVYPFFFIQQTQVPAVLVLETQVQERPPEIQVREYYATETQVQEIQSEMLVLVVQLRETKPRAWVPKVSPGTPVQEIQLGTHCIEISVPVTQLQNIPPGTQRLKIQVPVVQLQEIPSGTKQLEIQVPVTQLQEIQSGTHILVTHMQELQVPVAHILEIQPITLWLERQAPISDILFEVILGVGILFPAVPIVIQQCYIKRKLRALSKDAAVFAALVAAEDLKRGDPVRASLSMDKLLIALSHLLAQKSVDLEMSHVPPEDLMHITPRNIRRKAIFQAVQASEDTTDFQNKLCELASGLQSNADAGYLAAHKFLIWLNQKTESDHEASQSFFEKHPTLRTVIVYLGPSTVAALGGIVILVVKILR